MLTLKISEALGDELFEILQEIINRAKCNRDDTVMLYVTPILMEYGESLIKAKGYTKAPDKYTLPKVKKRSQFS